MGTSGKDATYSKEERERSAVGGERKRGHGAIRHQEDRVKNQLKMVCKARGKLKGFVAR